MPDGSDRLDIEAEVIRFRGTVCGGRLVVGLRMTSVRWDGEPAVGDVVNQEEASGQVEMVARAVVAEARNPGRSVVSMRDDSVKTEWDSKCFQFLSRARPEQARDMVCVRDTASYDARSTGRACAQSTPRQLL